MWSMGMEWNMLEYWGIYYAPVYIIYLACRGYNIALSRPLQQPPWAVGTRSSGCKQWLQRGAGQGAKSRFRRSPEDSRARGGDGDEAGTAQQDGYHCPFCGRIDSPSCGYISQSLEWKIEHSTKKPWNEEVTTTETVEVDEETFVDREVWGECLCWTSCASVRSQELVVW